MATKALTLRLDDDVVKKVYEFQYQNGMESPSVAIRALLEIALRDVKELEEALRRAAWRESTRNASKRLREEIDDAVARCLGAGDASTTRGERPRG